MSNANRTETILIREGARLPAGLVVVTDPFLPGWRVVKNPDRSALVRSIEAAIWNYFYLAGDIKAVVLGRDRPGTLRRAAKRVLPKRREQDYNSLEITHVVAKHFLGVPYLSVTAHSRHIQQDPYLVPAKTNFILRVPVAPNGNAAAKHFKVLISSA